MKNMESSLNVERKYKWIENTLEEFVQKIDIIMRNVPDVIYMLDPEGRIVFISDAIEKYGYKSNELIGTPILEIIHPLDMDKALWRVNERRTGERKTQACEIRLKTKDNTSITMEIQSRDIEQTPIFILTAEGFYASEENKFLGTVGVARDVTDRKTSEKSKRVSKQKKKQQLKRHIPICAHCKKIRTVKGTWKQVEEYISNLCHLKFTHGICPECQEKWFPELKIREDK
jgi:PAS domain S-box-containing protein